MKRFIIITSAVLLILLLFITFKKNNQYTDLVYPNVIINNINFGGKSKSEVEKYFSQINTKFKKINFEILYENNPIATFSGEQLKIGYDGKGIADRAYLIGRSDNTWSSIHQKLSMLFNWSNFKLTAEIQYDNSIILDYINSIKDEINIPAKNALFKFENGRVISFRQEKKGQEIEVNKFLTDFNQTVKGLNKNSKLKKMSLPVNEIEPEISLAKANDLGIEEFIAQGKSNFSHSTQERIHNIILAASKFNGVLMAKNSLFSFNDTVGDISALTGYSQAYIIKDGKTVLGDGGGVCQVSTTFFRAALNAGLPIVERTAHAYRVSYYENDSKPGFDATVFAPSPDLKVKNDTPASILIETEIDLENNLLYFKFFGKKDNRKIEISPVTIYDVVPPLPPSYQDDPTLKKGVVKQVDFPAWGSKVVFSYKVTNDNKITFAKNFYSNYQPWQAVYLVGTAD